MTPRFDWQTRSVAVVALGHEEAQLARYLVARLKQASLFVHASALTSRPTSDPDPAASGGKAEARAFDKIAVCLAELFDKVSGMVVVAPIGVTVRSIAPLLRSKLTDPAIVAVDALGRYAVSLLSGHEGGANDLSLLVAELLQAQPVITTTTEAKKRHVIGVGCRRGVPAQRIVAAVLESLERLRLDITSVRWLTSVDRKRDEPGLLEAAAELGLPLHFVRPEELRRWALTESAWVRHTLDLPAVAEPAAMLSGTRTRCLMPKTVFAPGITLAIAEETLPWSGSDQAPRTIEPTAPSEPFEPRI